MDFKEGKIDKMELNFDHFPKETSFSVTPEEIANFSQPYFSQLYQTHEHSDLNLKVNDNTLFLHRLVVDLWGTNLLEEINILPEKGQNGALVAQYNPTSSRFDYSAFLDLIEYMYKGSINASIVTKEAVVQLLDLADLFGFESLKTSCADLLAKLPNAQNLVPTFLEWAEKFSCQRLKQHAGILLAENFNQLMESNQLMDLDVSIWEGILQSTKIKVENEESLFSFVLIYAEQFAHGAGGEDTEQAKVLQRLLRHIKFEVMDPSFIIQNVEPLVFQIPELKATLYQAFKNILLDKVHSEREYDRIHYKWKRKGPNMTLSKGNRAVSCTTPWNQAQTDKPLLSGQYFEIKIVAMVPKTTNSYGLVVGVGPVSVPLSGGGSIIGYSGQEGVGWVLGDGQIFPTNLGRAGDTAQTGDVIKVMHTTKGELSFWKNKKFVCTVRLPLGTKFYPTVAMSGGQVELM